VTGTIDMKTVGMDMGAGHRQVNLDCICRGITAGLIARFENHSAFIDSIAESRQSLRELSGAIFEGTGALYALKRKGQGVFHVGLRETNSAPIIDDRV
jgi:hypothetical protein